MRILTASRADWPMVRRIFEEGIATGNATFTQSPPSSWSAWQDGKIDGCCLVAKEDTKVVGWASLEKVSDRPVYSGVAVVNIYVAASSRGRGIGSSLMKALIERAETLGIWTLEARVFPENSPSIRLHENHGFTLVGIRERIGRMEYGSLKGTWRNVLLLERRSKRIGTD